MARLKIGLKLPLPSGCHSLETHMEWHGSPSIGKYSGSLGRTAGQDGMSHAKASVGCNSWHCVNRYIIPIYLTTTGF